MGRGFTRKRRHSFASSTPLVEARQATGEHILNFDLGTCSASSKGPGQESPLLGTVFVQGTRRSKPVPVRGNTFRAPDGFTGQFFLGADCLSGARDSEPDLVNCQTINFSVAGGSTDVSLNGNAGIPGAKQVTVKVDGAAPLVCDAACAAGTSTPAGISSGVRNAAINVFFCPEVAAAAPPPSPIVPNPAQATDDRSQVNPAPAAPTATNVTAGDPTNFPSQPQDNNGPNVAAIAGGVTAAAVILGLLLAIFLWRKRKRQPSPLVFEVQAPSMTNTPQLSGGADLSTWVSTTSTVETSMTHKDELAGTNTLKPSLTTDTARSGNSLAAFIQDERTRFANIVQSHSPTSGHRPGEGPGA